MNYNTIITKLYFMLIYADGKVNEKEITIAKQMIRTEGINDVEFFGQLESLKTQDKAILFSDCMVALKTLDLKQQVRLVAWLCVLANGDGFMDRTEWQLIYKVYHKELNLSLHDIFTVQKELNRIIWENTSLTIL